MTTIVKNIGFFWEGGYSFVKYSIGAKAVLCAGKTTYKSTTNLIVKLGKK